MLIYKNNPTLPQGGPDIGLKVGILAEIGYMLHECALSNLKVYHYLICYKIMHMQIYGKERD